MSASWKQGNRRATTSGKAGTRTKWIEPRLPTESVKYLALGIFRHEVFTSGQVEEKEQHLLPSIFPALRSFTNERHREFNAHPPSLIYAYTKDSLNDRTVNGYPIFGTAGSLWQRDAEQRTSARTRRPNDHGKLKELPSTHLTRKWCAMLRTVDRRGLLQGLR